MAGVGRIARAFGNADLAARLAAESTPPVAGYLPYNPGPGIYSRLERAIEQMPENVRVQELPGLLRRYKDGVPGWELKATNLDEVIAGRDVVPREELIARVKERSPVHTHREIVLTDSGPVIRGNPYDDMAVPWDSPDYQDDASRLGQGIRHGDPRYGDYGQGGEDYAEILLTQPGAREREFGSHWQGAATNSTDANKDAVAHARFDTHGDALRINELQSDLGIHNRKVREQQAAIDRAIGDSSFIEYSRPDPSLPFPLEDAWADILIKRLALEAAQKGHRAIEVASPRAIADKVGGNIDNYEHFYGKVVPGALERLGRKMGGLVEDTATYPEAVAGGYDLARDAARQRAETVTTNAGLYADGFVGGVDPGSGYSLGYEIQRIADAVGGLSGADPMDDAIRLYESAVDLAISNGFSEEAAIVLVGQQMPHFMRMADDVDYAGSVASRLNRLSEYHAPHQPRSTPGRRYLMSDEMRRRLIQQGVGASLLAPLLLQEEAP
jgi:hypothetical protein